MNGDAAVKSETDEKDDDDWRKVFGEFIAETNNLYEENTRLRTALEKAIELASEGWEYCNDLTKKKSAYPERLEALQRLLKKRDC